MDSEPHRSYIPRSNRSSRADPRRAHNGYIEASLDLGIVGGFLLLLLGGSGVVAALRLGRGTGIDRMLGPILLAAIVGGMVESLVESGVLNAGGLFAFPFWMAVALAHSLRIAQMRGTFGAEPVATESLTGPRTGRISCWSAATAAQLRRLRNSREASSSRSGRRGVRMCRSIAAASSTGLLRPRTWENDGPSRTSFAPHRFVMTTGSPAPAASGAAVPKLS